MQNSTTEKSLKKLSIIIVLFLTNLLFAQTSTIIPSGSFIINTGVVPQTINNGLKPYGLVYALLSTLCPVDWVINTAKAKDGADFTYNGTNYSGGTFVVEAQYRTSAVNNLIATWTDPAGLYKEVGVTTTSPVTVPVYLTFYTAPRWTMDLKNGSVTTTFFPYASL